MPHAHTRRFLPGHSDPLFSHAPLTLTHIAETQLHSHEIPYGTGSGQQSVTGYPENDDTNSYFTVVGAFGKDCERGTPIPCPSTIRLRVRPPSPASMSLPRSSSSNRPAPAPVPALTPPPPHAPNTRST